MNLMSRFTIVEHVINSSIKNKEKIVEAKALESYKKQRKGCTFTNL